MEKQYGRKRILICDDSELLIAGLKCTIEQLPELSVVGQATNGQQFVDMVRELAPDMVIMDVRMPVTDGIEATKLIKEQYPAIRVLILTASTDIDTVRQSLFVGADGFCLKSSPREQLIAAIESVSLGAVWLAPAISQHLKASLRGHRSTKADRGNCEYLSVREKEVLDLLVAGLSNTEMAQRLILSPETVKTHVRHIYEKLRVRHRTEAVVEAIKRGLVAAA